MSVTKSIFVKFTAILILGIGVASANAQEITASHLAAAKRTIDLSGSTKRLDNILPQMAQTAKSELIRNLPDQQGVITDIVDTVAIGLAPRRGDLENEVAQIFSRVFNEQELQVIGDFFATEAGKKFLTESPVVVREIDRAARVWQNGVARDLNNAVSTKMREMGLQ